MKEGLLRSKNKPGEGLKEGMYPEYENTRRKVEGSIVSGVREYPEKG